MLIIFDLDDTLIDTSGCLTPLKLEAAFEKMVLEGLPVLDKEEALELLKHMNNTAQSFKFALLEFIEILEADKKYYEIGMKEMNKELSEDISIFPLDDVLEGLKELKERHVLCLVSSGKKELQFEKMKKAGIDSAIFSKIVICESGNKKIHYEAMRTELGFLPNQVVVCGDRIEFDLLPAKELGFMTIQMQRGRGLYSKPHMEEGITTRKSVDFAAKEFKEVKELISTFE